MSVIQNIEVSVSEGLICETLYRHALKTFDVPRFREFSMKGFTLQYSMGMAKPSVE